MATSGAFAKTSSAPATSFPKSTNCWNKWMIVRRTRLSSNFSIIVAMTPLRRRQKDWARGYVTGFHAADPAQISVHSLVKGLRAALEIEGDRAFRIRSRGYEALLE